ncbi:unnamed protein product [Adineta ricciae]|uniref:Uncharacterized protein n=1 Tax=Adineta ricciae TaxID=249248 RepID=A0A814I2N1_ADIRI|nr:unnamed protein product [Adineta ricciae]CAF1379670.1 unnamed protein product [Adineta ricciae]
MYTFAPLFSVIFVFGTINTLPSHRFRRQTNFVPNTGSSGRQSSAWLNAPSGSIPGSAYYGVGADPNYGSYVSAGNRPNNAIVPISYNPDSSSFINNRPQTYISNANTGWQSTNMNTNYGQYSGNRYSPGSPGWYATGGNFWYNDAQSLVVYPFLLFISILLLIICQ